MIVQKEENVQKVQRGGDQGQGHLDEDHHQEVLVVTEENQRKINAKTNLIV